MKKLLLISLLSTFAFSEVYYKNKDSINLYMILSHTIRLLTQNYEQSLQIRSI